MSSKELFATNFRKYALDIIVESYFESGICFLESKKRRYLTVLLMPPSTSMDRFVPQCCVLVSLEPV